MLVTSILKTKGRDVYTVGPDISVLEAVQELRKKRVGAMLVCDTAGAILGVLSERDIVRALADGGMTILAEPVHVLMTREVVSCTLTDSIDHVMMLMTDRRIRHVPVIDHGKLAGLISIGDVVKQRIAETEMEAEAMKHYIATG
ncbi:CBS domain-containing protein [Govanella unica]|uniref:CBS domain-containing protein n=1 Tax=Govanella unica TaxID=2975056 RepID=A0A9X3U2A3_9PROT|nr:CBS domain-containing protein [Govania unica]MDA5195114.1 CBS domain-containing protein [Govania unica]